MRKPTVGKIIVRVARTMTPIVYSPRGIEDLEESSKVLRSVRQVNTRASMTEVVPGLTGLPHHVPKHVRIVDEYVRLHPERGLFANKNYVATSEVEFLVLGFAKLGCGSVGDVKFFAVI
jgi:hypothetical protein